MKAILKPTIIGYILVSAIGAFWIGGREIIADTPERARHLGVPRPNQ